MRNLHIPHNIQTLKICIIITTMHLVVVSVYNNVNSSVTISVCITLYILFPCVIISFVILCLLQNTSSRSLIWLWLHYDKAWLVHFLCLHIAQKKYSYNLSMFDMYIVMAIAAKSQVIANVTPPTDHVK